MAKQAYQLNYNIHILQPLYYERCTSLLLSCSGAHIDCKTATHFTPLLAAIRHTQPEPVRLLLGQGADVMAKDGQRSYNAVLWAVEMQNSEVLKVR